MLSPKTEPASEHEVKKNCSNNVTENAYKFVLQYFVHVAW